MEFANSATLKNTATDKDLSNIMSLEPHNSLKTLNSDTSSRATSPDEKSFNNEKAKLNQQYYETDDTSMTSEGEDQLRKKIKRENDNIWRIDPFFLEEKSNQKELQIENSVYSQVKLHLTQLLEELSQSKETDKPIFQNCSFDSISIMPRYNLLKSKLKEKYLSKISENTLKISSHLIFSENKFPLPENQRENLVGSNIYYQVKKTLHKTPIGPMHQAIIPQFRLNQGNRQRRRPAKLIWSSDAISEEVWEAYMKKISEIIGQKISKEDVVAKHLKKFHGNISEAIQDIKKSKAKFRSSLRICQINLRNRTRQPECIDALEL